MMCDDIFSEAYLFYSSSRFEQTPRDAWILTIRINTTIIIIIIIIIIGIIIIIIAIILIRAMFITKVLTDWWRGGLHEGCKSNSPGDPLVILNHVHHTNHNYHDNDLEAKPEFSIPVKRKKNAVARPGTWSINATIYLKSFLWLFITFSWNLNFCLLHSFFCYGCCLLHALGEFCILRELPWFAIVMIWQFRATAVGWWHWAEWKLKNAAFPE